ncbi:MAG: hypothetical protein R3C59_25020 [Planctomycetaceae bacterium]
MNTASFGPPFSTSNSDVPGNATARTTIALLLFWMVAFVMVRWAGTANGDDHSHSRQEQRRARFQELRETAFLTLRHELSELSQRCHDQGLLQAAQDLTAISLELTNSQNESFRLPSMVQLPVSSRLPEAERLWRVRLRALREDKAAELYSLGRKALGADLPTLAYQLIKDTLRLDPDHQASRRTLGLQLFHDRTRQDDDTYAGEWVSEFEARKRSGSVPEENHPEFGWIPSRHVARYENGERPWKTGWVSVAKEAELRRDFRNAWEIESEHFLVKTNTSREEGVRIVNQLEMFHEWLTSNFAAFFETPAELKKRFEEAQPRSRSVRDAEPMKVHYYATRAEYDRVIRSKSELLARVVTNGLYWEPDRTSYFFRNPDDESLLTVFHEATHQILDLATAADRRTAARKRKAVLRQPQIRDWVMCENSNFWMLEGIACYFESIRISDGAIVVGDPGYVRFQAAQQRLLRDNFYVPLQLFSGLGKDAFQHHPNLPQLYSQASGFAHFLLHYQNGTYRDDFVRLLSAAYRPDLKNVLKEPSLEEITGVKFAVLDQQYREHLHQLSMQTAQIEQP